MTDPAERPLPLRVLIICTHFPPTNATGARRPYYLAKQLAASGHVVTVLTSVPEGSDRWDVELQGMHVVRRARTFMQRDLNGFQRRLAMLHHRSAGTVWHGPLRVIADLLLPLEHAVRWDITVEELDRIAGRQDIVVATGPGWSTAEFGSAAAHHWKAYFNLDYRDPWSVSDPQVAMDIVTYQGAGVAGLLRQRHMRRTEQRILSSVHLITATSEAFARNAARLAPPGTPAVPFTGGFDPDLWPPQRTPSEHFTITYAGRLYPEQDWDALFDAMDRLMTTRPDLALRLRLRFVGPVSTDQALLKRIHQPGNACIITIPRCSRNEAIAWQHDTDAVLHLTYRGRKGYLPVKLLEYLGANRPLILFSAENEEAEDIVRRTRVGVQVRDRGALYALLVERLEAHVRGERWVCEADMTALQEFAYPERMEPWARALRQLVLDR